MDSIKVEKMTNEQLVNLGVFTWSIWTKEVSRFDWTYEERERCYFLEGSVTVQTPTERVSFGAGDFVTFPKGLSCLWVVEKPVKKHYKFG